MSGTTGAEKAEVTRGGSVERTLTASAIDGAGKRSVTGCRISKLGGSRTIGLRARRAAGGGLSGLANCLEGAIKWTRSASRFSRAVRVRRGSSAVPHISKRSPRASSNGLNPKASPRRLRSSRVGTNKWKCGLASRKSQADLADRGSLGSAAEEAGEAGFPKAPGDARSRPVVIGPRGPGSAKNPESTLRILCNIPRFGWDLYRRVTCRPGNRSRGRCAGESAVDQASDRRRCSRPPGRPRGPLPTSGYRGFPATVECSA